MPYKFNFDLSSLYQNLFRELFRIAREKRLHRRIGSKLRDLNERFRISKITGLDINTSISLLEDFVDVFVENYLQRERFLKTSKRALLLPHCSRKYMDSRCEANFDSSLSSYFCNSCSPDCLINKASKLGKERGYDVYILPGSSCIPKILERGYEAVVGVACCEELKLGLKYLQAKNIPGQGIPLIKNGCANTRFSLEMLEKIL